MSDHVNNDLINEIFERLPPKSLLRFRSLSKSWCSHIQSTDFISRDHIYTLHSEDQFVSSNPEWLDVSIPAVKFPRTKGDTPIGDIVGSCNGIMCLYYYSNRTISLWNPSIRRATTLPPASCNPIRGAILVGIGFDQSIDDYKIVRISQNYSFVYTLKTGAWCLIASPSTEVGYQESCVCFFNGALYWVVVRTYKNRDPRYTLTFDLTTHAYGTMFLPKPNWETRELKIMDGSLATIPLRCWIQPPDGRENSIWILKESNKFWHAVYDFGQFNPKWNHLNRGAKSVLHLTTNGHMLLYIGYRLPNFSEGDTYGVYNPETGTWDPSMMMCFQDSQHIDMQTYVETLELLDTEPNCLEKNGKRKIDEIVR